MLMKFQQDLIFSDFTSPSDSWDDAEECQLAGWSVGKRKKCGREIAYLLWLNNTTKKEWFTHSVIHARRCSPPAIWAQAYSHFDTFPISPYSLDNVSMVKRTTTPYILHQSFILLANIRFTRPVTVTAVFIQVHICDTTQDLFIQESTHCPSSITTRHRARRLEVLEKITKMKKSGDGSDGALL